MFGLTDTAKAIIGLISLCLIAFLAWKGLSAVYTMGYDAANVRAEKVIGEFMAAERDAVQQAREAEQAAQAKVDRIGAEEYERGYLAGQDSKARTIAGLRDGTVRLRREIGALYTERLSSTAETSVILTAAAQRGEEIIGAAAGVGAECDARQLGWQRYAEAVTQ